MKFWKTTIWKRIAGAALGGMMMCSLTAPALAEAGGSQLDGDLPQQVTEAGVETTDIEMPGIGHIDDVVVLPESKGRAIVSAPTYYSKQYMYEQLDDASKLVYDAILASPLGKGPSMEKVYISFDSIPQDARIWPYVQTITNNDGVFDWRKGSTRASWNYADDAIKSALGALLYDHVELSWLVNVLYCREPDVAIGCSVDFNIANGVTKQFEGQQMLHGVTFYYDKSSYDTLTMDPEAGVASGSPWGARFIFADTKNLAVLNRSLSQAKSEIGTLSGKSEYEKVKAIHDWICKHMDYADQNGEKFLNGWRGYQTVYSGMVLGETVCAGYAKSMKLLCDAYGIPCVMVAGDAGGPHAWDYVQVEGGWYGVDCTWDDLLMQATGTLQYDYFLKGELGFSDHVEGAWNDELLFSYPQLSSNDYEPAAAPVNRTALASAVQQAKTLQAGTVSSVNGQDVSPASVWATPSALKVLTAAISKAEGVLAGTTVSQNDVDRAASELQGAIRTLESQRKAGLKPAQTAKPSATPQPTVRPTATPKPTPVPTVEPSATAKPTPTATLTPTATPAPTVKPQPTETPDNSPADQRTMDSIESSARIARVMLEEIRASEDGSDIPTTRMWVPTQKWLAVQTALEYAEHVLRNNPTQTVANEADRALNQALAACEGIAKYGTKEV